MNTFQFEKKMNVSEILKEIEDWISIPEFRELIHSFGGDYESNTTLEERIRKLQKFSDVWDFRNRQKKDLNSAENARWTIEDNQLSEKQKNLTMKAAKKLGLIGCTVPSQKHYDYILALGGAQMSCLFRMKFAKELCDQYDVSVQSIAGLVGMRKVMESERNATDTYAPDAETELDLMRASVKKVFGSLEITEKQEYISKNENESWVLERYSYDIPIILMAAPSGEPEKRRANTADTFAFFREHSNIEKNKSILLVTSQIYVPYQQLEAIRMLGLPYGYSLETLGFPNEWSIHMKGLNNPENYLQEIRSVIQSAGRLLNENKLCE